MTRRSRATSPSRRASRYSASSVIRQPYPARPCPVEPLILAPRIRKRGTFSTFGGTPADLQQRTHHCTHPPADRYLGERSRGRCRPNLKPAPVAPDRFEPRRTTMSTTSHPLHRELPHADDELMTIKGGGHPPATRPRRALHQRAANRWARGATPPRVDPRRCGDPRHVKKHQPRGDRQRFGTYPPRVWAPKTLRTGLGKGVSTTFGGTCPDLRKHRRTP